MKPTNRFGFFRSGRRCIAFLITGIVVFAATAFGQTTVGIPPLTSTTASGFDVVDNATLDVMFSVPILKKAGRGLPFNFALAYNSYVWTPVTTNSVTAWTPVTTSKWGWTSTPTGAGSVSYTTTLNNCFQAPGGKYTWSVWSNFIYTDNSGTQHPFSFTISNWSLQGAPCGSGASTTASGVAIDASGFTLAVQGTTSGTVPVQLTSLSDRSGNTYGASITGSTGSNTVTDPNGNTLKVSGGTYTDTL